MQKEVVKLNLEDNLEDFDTFISDPFIIFEKKNFLDESTYHKLVDEIYSMRDFEFVYSGRGEKEKSSINGNNVNKLKEGIFKQFCMSCLSIEFFKWFENTHLPYFKFLKIKKYFYIKKPRSFSIRLINKLIKILNIPICFFYTEVEYSSIKKNNYIPPHTDAFQKRLSFVYYLPSKNKQLTQDMKESLGTVFWKPKLSAKDPIRRFDCQLLIDDEKESFYNEFEPFHIATYDSNKFAGFIKSDNSWHTVEKFNFDYDRRAIVINLWQL